MNVKCRTCSSENYDLQKKISSKTEIKKNLKRRINGEKAHVKYLGFVPIVRLLDVFGCQVLILQSDISQSGCQIRFGQVHIHLHLLTLDLCLQLSQLLQQTERQRFPCSAF